MIQFLFYNYMSYFLHHFHVWWFKIESPRDPHSFQHHEQQ